MTFFEWSSQLDLGVKSMNDEHQVLIAIMNRLFDRNGAGAKHAELAKIIDELAAYTVKHFADEEAYMASINFPDLGTHKLIHKQLLESFTRHKTAYDGSGADQVPQAFFSFLSLWLSAHIKGIDMKYAAHGRGKKSA